MIDEIRNTWQFYRDRRLDAYDELNERQYGGLRPSSFAAELS